MKIYNKLIIGAGIYGLYSGLKCVEKGECIKIIECDPSAFMRASYINQARVHLGYHYPRSISTALKSRHYFDRFNKDYHFCVNKDFEKVYSVSSNFSWTNAAQFQKFCKDANIECTSIESDKYFNSTMCEGSFLTKEYTYDAQILKNYFIKECEKHKNIEISYNTRIEHIEKNENYFIVKLDNGQTLKTNYILNATYAGINQVLSLLEYEPFKIKYELCEVIICKVNSQLKDIGITVMDGPFLSIMPFGKTGYHSLTSVTFTPHMTCYNFLPKFNCQAKSNGYCNELRLGNCNECPAKPESAWPYMSRLAQKYIKDIYKFEYVYSLFSMKPILQVSEIDDSRPTVIRKHCENPTFVSVLSGKINTVYDLDEVL